MKNLGGRIALNEVKLLWIMAICLFGGAGTLRFWQAWLYLAIQLVGLTATNLYLVRCDRALLERRLVTEEAGEKEPLQKKIMALFRLLTIVLYVICGLDHRFHWSRVPMALSIAAGVAFASAMLLIFAVFRTNTFASSIVDIDPHHRLVQTGPYQIVRHPMYLAALIMTAASPLVTGSWWAELILLAALPLLVMRLLAEETFLKRRLPGYARYMTATRSRLIPRIW